MIANSQERCQVQDDLAALFNWLIIGAHRYYQTGTIHFPEMIQQYTSEHRVGTNPYVRFIKETYELLDNPSENSDSAKSAEGIPREYPVNIRDIWRISDVDTEERRTSVRSFTVWQKAGAYYGIP